MATACPGGAVEEKLLRKVFERYVAIGDSTTEGLDDPDGAGGFRGWANRFAEAIAAAQGHLLYANLAVRGRITREVLEQQLPAATAMRPRLATVVAGTNDLMRRAFDAAELGRQMEHMQRELARCGATVLTFTLPDLVPVLPLARLVSARRLLLNDALRQAAARSGAILVDLAAHPFASDPRLWSEDRLHANAAGHARIAASLACAVGLAGDEWATPLPPVPPPALASRLRSEAVWWKRHFGPWVWRRATGRSSGDGRGPKRPELLPVEP